MDGKPKEKPVVWQPQDALYRTMFKQEELVEFVRAASRNEEEFDRSVAALHEALDKAADKVRSKHPAEISMVGQVDALIDTLYLTYGSFVLMGSILKRSLRLFTGPIWARFSQMERRTLIQ